MPRFQVPRFLPPKVADWLIENVDRPLGFWITLLIGVISGRAFVLDHRGSDGMFAGWPVPALAVTGFVVGVLGVCLVLVLLWCVKWVLYTLVLRPLRWFIELVTGQGRDA